jgi:hypothetical protein
MNGRPLLQTQGMGIAFQKHILNQNTNTFEFNGPIIFKKTNSKQVLKPIK